MKKLIFLLCMLGSMQAMAQQPFVANYDENKVGNFTLPNPLKKTDGSLIQSVKDWEIQRTYWLGLYEQYMFGKMPKKKIAQSYQLISKTNIMAGKATQYIWKLTFAGKYDVTVLGVLPNVKTKVPVFIGLNFCGNQTTSSDPNIPLFDKFTVCNNKPDYVNNKGQESSRGSWSSRWQFEKLIAAGYGSITIACGDFEEDKADGYLTGVRSVLAKELGLQADEWSANGAWAWGLNRTVDFLEKIPQIDAKRIILHGHSRLGKAALWAGVNDNRYAAVISNESGEGGAAISRRNYGENLWRITNSFPHWFYKDYKNYAYKENDLPFDSHILMSLIAPRPIYIASAVGDQWSDPKGEFMGGQQAEAVYQLYGKTGLGKNDFPALNTPVGQQVRYHIREGNHDINAYDWDQYIDFANKLIK